MRRGLPSRRREFWHRPVPGSRGSRAGLRSCRSLIRLRRLPCCRESVGDHRLVAKSFEDAVAQGIARANKTLKNVRGAWIAEQKSMIDKGKVVAYG